MKAIYFLIVLCSVFGCSESEQDPQVSEKPNLRVNYYTVTCTGEMTGECLLVQEGDEIGTEEWSYFYYVDGIEGFDYEEGYVYDLVVEKTPIENPPMDAPSIHYELVKLISKKKIED